MRRLGWMTHEAFGWRGDVDDASDKDDDNHDADCAHGKDHYDHHNNNHHGCTIAAYNTGKIIIIVSVCSHIRRCK